MSQRHRFRSAIEAARGGGAVALIPADVVDDLGGPRRMRVTGSVDGIAYQSNTFPWHGRLYLGVHKATREKAGVDIGTEVEIELVRDDRPRVVDLAPELEAAFAAEPDLRSRFDGLSMTRRRELADPVALARRPATRASRVEKALARLREMD